jgi:hypothetical protein
MVRAVLAAPFDGSRLSGGRSASPEQAVHVTDRLPLGVVHGSGVLGEELRAVRSLVIVERLPKHGGPAGNAGSKVLPAMEAHMLGDPDQAGDGVPEGIPVQAVEAREAQLPHQKQVQGALIGHLADINRDHGVMLACARTVVWDGQSGQRPRLGGNGPFLVDRENERRGRRFRSAAVSVRC